jgi:phosphoglycerol transferase
MSVPTPQGSDHCRPAGSWRSLARSLAEYAGAALVCVALLFLVLRLWRADWTVPLGYGGDSILTQTLIKSILDHGWYLHNDSVGFPQGMDLHDFPLADSLHFLLIKALGWFWPHSAAVYNLFFLLTFPLTTLTALFVFARLGCAYPVALVAALLYALLPYHFIRFGHLFLASYYLVPLQIWLAVRLYRGDNPFRTRGWLPLSALGTVVICLLTGAAGVYYAFFSCYFLLVAAVVSWFARRERSTLWAGAISIALIGLSLGLTLSPSLLHRWREGVNPDAVQRDSAEAEVHGLRVTQLLLPVTGHRVSRLNRLKRDYNTPNRSLSTEGDSSSLGAVAGVGFLYLLAHLVLRRRTRAELRLPDGLAILTAAALILASVGGLGALFSYLVTPLIRGYSRISVFIAFFALAAVGMLLQRLWQRYQAGSRGRALVWALLAGVLVLGVLDQTTDQLVPPYEALAQEYRADAEFVRRIEERLPAQTPVYQLPALPFPEYATPQGYLCYDLFRPYLHSRHLRWSFGSLRGTECDDWRLHRASQPLEQLVEELALAEFGALCVDRAGYADHGAAVERQLARVLGTPSLVSANGRLAYYELTPYARALRRRCGPKQWARHREAVWHPVAVQWRNGCTPMEEYSSEGFRRWCGAQAGLSLHNPLDHPRTVRLQMKCVSETEPLHLILDSDLFHAEVGLDKQGQQITQQLVVPPGRHSLHFHCAGIDPRRKWVFRVVNLTVTEDW